MKAFNEIKEILIAGGGMMGKNIAFVMTKNPQFHVTVYDLYPTDVEAGIRANTKQLVERGHLTEDELAERLSRIYFTTDIDDPAIAAADFIEDEGFMYYLYDLSILDQKAATHAVKMYFSEQRSATSCPDKAPK